MVGQAKLGARRAHSRTGVAHPSVLAPPRGDPPPVSPFQKVPTEGADRRLAVGSRSCYSVDVPVDLSRETNLVPTCEEYETKILALEWPDLLALWDGIKVRDTPEWAAGKAFEYLVEVT